MLYPLDISLVNYFSHEYVYVLDNVQIDTQCVFLMKHFTSPVYSMFAWVYCINKWMFEHRN